MSAGRRLLYALVLVLVALVSYSFVEAVGQGGRSNQARPSRSLPRSAAATPSTQATPARGSTDSPRGAASAAALYLQVLDNASRSAATSRQLRALTLPPLTGTALQVEAASAALKAKLSQPGPAFIRGWRLGWRALSFEPHAARIAVWAMGMVQSPHAVLTPNYSTTVCTLHWTDGRWRVSAAATKPGPAPPTDGSDHSAVASFVREANRFRPFADAP
jgi:hypothetical protein